MTGYAARHAARRATPGARFGVAGQSGAAGAAAMVGLLSSLCLDILVASRFGAGEASDAYTAGSRLPLALATMFLIAAGQSLVPTFAGWSHDATTGLISTASEQARSTGLLVRVASLTAAIGLALAGSATALVSALTPGLSAEQHRTASTVLTVMSIAVPLSAVSEVLRAWLNAQHAFVAPALVLVLLNLTAAVVLVGSPRAGVVLLAWGMVGGGVVRVIILAAMAARRGLRLRLTWAATEPEVMAALRRCARPAFGSGLVPAARTAEQVVASFLPSGSMTVLSYAYRAVNGLSGAVFFRSVMVALTPRLTVAFREKDVPRQERLTGLGIRLMATASVPLAGLLAVMAVPGVVLTFQRGRFHAADAQLLGLLVVVLCAALPADALSRALLAPFTCRLDTITPFRNVLVGLGVNLLGLVGVALLEPHVPGSLALLAVGGAYVASQWSTVLHAAWRLHRTGPRPHVLPRRTAALLLPATGAGLLAAAAVSRALALNERPPGLALAGGVLAALGAAAVAFALLTWPVRARWRELLATPVASTSGITGTTPVAIRAASLDERLEPVAAGGA